jgi:hypothetical protein
VQIEFNFMISDERYRAEIPEVAYTRGQASAVSLNGTTRSIQYRDVVEGSDELFRGKVEAGAINVRGARVALFDQPDPFLHFLYWQTESGYVWTHSDPTVEPAGRDILTSSVTVNARASLPSLRLSRGVGAGDIRRWADRESVILYLADEERSAITFTRAGAFAADSDQQLGATAAARRASAAGLEVTCDGSANRAATLEAAASAIAASVVRVG